MKRRRQQQQPAASDGASGGADNAEDVESIFFGDVRGDASIFPMYESGELCDGTVHLDGVDYPVSRMALSAASPFFKAAFAGGFSEASGASVTIDPSLSRDCVEALLRYAHHFSGSVDVHLSAFVVAADQLGFASILQHASTRLALTMSEGNFFARLILAQRYGLSRVLDAGARLLSEHADALCRSVEFVTLSRDTLASLLSHEELRAPRELPLYEGLLAWRAHDESRAFAPFESLLELIRLSELGLPYLINHVVHADAIRFGTHRVRELVQQAITYLTIPEQRMELHSTRMEPRSASLPDFGDAPGLNVKAFSEDGRKSGWRIMRSRGFIAPGSSHAAVASQVLTSFTTWSFKMAKRALHVHDDGDEDDDDDDDDDEEEDGADLSMPWACVGVGVGASPSPGSFKEATSYGWGGPMQVANGDTANYWRNFSPSQTHTEASSLAPDAAGWDGWKIGDEATFRFDKVNGLLSMRRTRGKATQDFKLLGLDPSLPWRVHVNLSQVGTTVELY